MAKRINKTIINFWVDVSLLIIFLLLCWIVIVLRYVFPVAAQAEGWKLWGYDYLAWSDLHFATLCAMLGTVLLHVMLHWTWVCGVIENWQRKRKGETGGNKADTGNRTLWGVGLLIVILNVLGLAIAVAALSIEAPVS